MIKMYAISLLFVYSLCVPLRRSLANTSLTTAIIGRMPTGYFDITDGSGRNEIDYILSQAPQAYQIINWGTPLWFRSELDTALPRIDNSIDYLYSVSRNGKGSYKTILSIIPRFSSQDGITDRQHNGTTIVHNGRMCPNYQYVDVFDPAQTAKFNEYVSTVALHYRENPAVAGFLIGWGFYAEGGYDYGGGCGQGDGAYGSRTAGYSINAINAFKAWATTQGLSSQTSTIDPNNPSTWGPILPSSQDPQPVVYAQWMRFRNQAIRQFQEGMVSAAKQAAPGKPVGLFDYLVWTPGSYARGWVDTPNADFTMSQFDTGTQYYDKTILETDFQNPGVGPKPAGLDTSSFSQAFLTLPWPWYKIQMIREIARGAGAMAFYRPEFAQSGFFSSLSSFLSSEYRVIQSRIAPEQTYVALFIPTWSLASYPSGGGTTPFQPTNSDDPDAWDTGYYINLLESLGVNYDFIREEDLLDPVRVNQRKAKYQVTFIPSSRYFGAAMTDAMWQQMDKSGLYGIYNHGEHMTQDQMRSALSERNIPTKSIHIVSGNTFNGTRALVGITNGIAYNFTDQSQTITIQYNQQIQSMTLQPFGYQFLAPPSPIPGDLNSDRKVNVADLRSALSQSPLSIFTYNLVAGNYGR